MSIGIAYGQIISTATLVVCRFGFVYLPPIQAVHRHREFSGHIGKYKSTVTLVVCGFGFVYT